MKNIFRKFSLKTYRLLRHPKHRRKSRLRDWLAHRVFDKALWRPAREPLAVGLAVGLMVSMLPPIPIQMLIAAILAMLLRVNIPAAAAGVWFSNPATWLPLWTLQFQVGKAILPSFEAPSQMKRIVEGVAEYTIGAIVVGVVVAGLGYLIALGIWDWSAWLVAKRKRAHDRAVPEEPASVLSQGKATAVNSAPKEGSAS